MDYFIKIKERLAQPKRVPPPGVVQLAKMERAWKYIQSTCLYHHKWTNVRIESTPLPAQIKVIVDVLVQEELRRSDSDDTVAGACMEYLLRQNILGQLVVLAEHDQPLGFRAEVIRMLSHLINLLDDNFLIHRHVHNPILVLLRQMSKPASGAALYTPVISPAAARNSPVLAQKGTQKAYEYCGDSTTSDEEDLVELMYVICSKIHGYPALLHIFFQDRSWIQSMEQQHRDPLSDTEEPPSETGHPDTPQPQYEFLLLSHLLRFTHRQGRVGDIARTSILFLLELTTIEITATCGSTSALEKFVLNECGFAAMISAGLDALYSQLPRRVRLAIGGTSTGSATQQKLLASSRDVPKPSRQAAWWRDAGDDAVLTNDPEFQGLVEAFLVHIEFIQDVLDRCPSALVCRAMLEHFYNHFLVSIFYPSLLESSDADGSSVAVMVYLGYILQTVQQPDLAKTLMGFLLGVPEISHEVFRGPSDRLASGDENDIDVSLVVPFTLRDLICSNLQSTVSQDAVIAALNLLKTIVTEQCRFANRLFEMEPQRPSDVRSAWLMNYTVAMDIHQRELEMYSDLVHQLDHSAAWHGTPKSHPPKLGRPQISATAAAAAGACTRSPGPHECSTILGIQGMRHRSLGPTERETWSYGPHYNDDTFSHGYINYLSDASNEWELHREYHLSRNPPVSAALATGFSGFATPTGDMQHLYQISPASTPGPGTPTVLSARERYLCGEPPTTPTTTTTSKRRSRKYSDAIQTLAVRENWRLPSRRSAAALSTIDEGGNSGTWSHIPPSPAEEQATAASQVTLARSPVQSCSLAIKSSDPILRSLLHLLTKFFAQNRECNLALTGVFSALILCPSRSLENWFGFEKHALVRGPLLRPWQRWLDHASRSGGMLAGDSLKGIYGADSNEDDDDSDGDLAAFVRGGSAKALSEGGRMPCGPMRSGQGGSDAHILGDGENGDGDEAEAEAEADKMLQCAIRALPEGATLPLLYAILKGLVQQAQTLSIKVPYFESRVRRARNALMGVVEDENELIEELECARMFGSGASRDNDGGNGNGPDEGMSELLIGTLGGSGSRHNTVSDRKEWQQQQQQRSRRNSASTLNSQSRLPTASPTRHGRRSGSMSTAGDASDTAVSPAASTSLSPTPQAKTSQALAIPPSNPNMHGYIENVIILQEAIKEWVARVQTRRENGGDELTIR
ncbi:hypothetical protein EV182_001549 [Spiromyces aspiralis]|uniref:Uncharacterized protein n=1 Tax=Spiromyces aspiralis TaxID=68401 RepID=A0ACC1HZ29_9FUNG|nr:hypothetical protein EV182_001549 [Spiromyces aspiralis]